MEEVQIDKEKLSKNYGKKEYDKKLIDSLNSDLSSKESLDYFKKKFPSLKALPKIPKKCDRIQEASKKELGEVDEIKDNIISNVSHELRTPITIAKGAIEMALDEEDNEEKRELLVMAKGALERQNNIVGDLVSIQKINDGI
jgi:hypothetical protein